MDRELVCILSLSVCFMILFSAELTLSNMQKTLVSSIADSQPGFKVEGYTVIGVGHTMFAISVWFGPYFTYNLGPKPTMILCAVGMFCKGASFALEDEIAIYAGAVIVGISAGLLWPAHGYYMIEMSTPQNTLRNMGIFSFIFSSSGALGNLFVYYTFHGKKFIDQSTRRTVLSILMFISALGVVAFTFLPKLKVKKTKDYGPLRAVKKCVKVLTSSKMLWLSLTFVYAGLQQSFWHGIYSPSVGFTLAFGDSAKELVALSGIFMSIGAVLGSACPIVLSGWIKRNLYARRLLVVIAIMAQICAFAIAYVNLPDRAMFGNTDDIGMIQPSAILAMLGSALLCFGDACLTIQIYAIIAASYRESSAEACALYKFFKGMVVAFSFFFCKYFGLHAQLKIITVAAVIGLIGIFKADSGSLQEDQRKDKLSYEQIKDSKVVDENSNLIKP